MEAYLDSLLYRTNEKQFDLIVTRGCGLPEWVCDHQDLNVKAYTNADSTGVGRIWTAKTVVSRYLEEHHPSEVRQITQPRWHAPGVILGVRDLPRLRSSSISVSTRLSASMFEEYRNASSKTKAWIANNVIGRSAFLADQVYTPQYGGVSIPWWSSAMAVQETREVNKNRFHQDVEPLDGVFSRTDRRVLTVGRISQRKGIGLLLAVAESLPQWEFTIVGPISDIELAEEARESENVSLCPPVDYVEMPSLYAACDVVLSTSRVEWGGVSRAMLEGQASGKHVVALDRGQAANVADEVVPARVDRIATSLQSLL